MREYEAIEFYSRERIRELSQKGLIHQELKQRIDELLRCRASGRFSTSLLISSCVLIARSLSHDSLWMKAISWAYAKSDRRCTHETAERCARPDMKDAAITAVCLRPSPTASTSPLCFSRQTVKQIVPVIDDVRAFGETAPEHWDVAFCLG